MVSGYPLVLLDRGPANVTGRPEYVGVMNSYTCFVNVKVSQEPGASHLRLECR